jgi:hypothetical protein
MMDLGIWKLFLEDSGGKRGITMAIAFFPTDRWRAILSRQSTDDHFYAARIRFQLQSEAPIVQCSHIIYLANFFFAKSSKHLARE